MNDMAIEFDQRQEDIFGYELTDEALEAAAFAGAYTLAYCHPTDRCTAPAMPALLIKADQPD